MLCLHVLLVNFQINKGISTDSFCWDKEKKTDENGIYANEQANHFKTRKLHKEQITAPDFIY